MTPLLGMILIFWIVGVIIWIGGKVAIVYGDIAATITVLVLVASALMLSECIELKPQTEVRITITIDKDE